MYTLEVTSHFDAAHRLPEYNGPCRRLHGHRWLVKPQYEFAKLGQGGMAFDLNRLKQILKSVLQDYDHQGLNDILPCTPTAENLAKIIFKRLQAKSAGEFLVAVTVDETPDTHCIYRETLSQDPIATVIDVAKVNNLNKELVTTEPILFNERESDAPSE